MSLSLLEKIHQLASNKRVIKSDASDAVHSIIRHLRKILNVKQGGVLLDERLGVPDWVDFASNYPDSFSETRKAVAYTIERMEPRLENVDVKMLSRDFSNEDKLYFQITASIKDMNKTLVLNHAFDADGGIILDGGVV